MTGATSTPQPLSADIVQAGPADDLAPGELATREPASNDLASNELAPADQSATSFASIEPHASVLPENSPPTDLDTPVDTPNETAAAVEPPKNVLPFRPIGDARPLTLTPVENSAFNELARQLSARLDSDEDAAATATDRAKLRGRLEELLKAGTEPWKTTRPTAAGKTEMTTGYDPNSEMQDTRRRNRSTGGEEIANLGDIALPLLKLEQVRRQDQPARLFQMLEGKTRQNQLPILPQW